MEDVLEDDDGVVDDDTDRERQREQRDRVEREAHAPHQRERADDADRDRDCRDDRAPEVAEEEEHDERGEEGAADEVLLHAVDARADDTGVVANDLDLGPGRERALEVLEPRPHRVDDLDRVGARLLADREDDRRISVEDRGALRLFPAVLDAADVTDADRVARLLADDEIANLVRPLDAAVDAERELLRAGVDAPARHREVLGPDRALDVERRHVDGAHLDRIEPDVHLALLTADDRDLADAVDRLEVPAHALVGELGDLLDRLPRPLEREVDDRRRVGIELLHGGQVDALGEIRDDQLKAIADLLRGDVGALLEDEADDDLRNALGRDRGDLLDAADRVAGLLDLLRDLGLDVFGSRAGQTRDHDDDRKIDVGEAIEPELRVPRQSDDGDEKDEDRREDRPLDADLG